MYMKGYKQLNQEQGYIIAQLLKHESSLPEIARMIKVYANTVSRKIELNKSKYALIVLQMPICSLDSVFNGDSTLDFSRQT